MEKTKDIKIEVNLKIKRGEDGKGEKKYKKGV